MAYDLNKAAENAVFCASGTRDDRPCKSCWDNLKRMVGPMPASPFDTTLLCEAAHAGTP